jgi:hypothetical protein
MEEDRVGGWAGEIPNALPSSKDGRTALQAASENGHLDIVQLLLQNGAHPNAQPSDISGWLQARPKSRDIHSLGITVYYFRRTAHSQLAESPKTPTRSLIEGYLFIGVWILPLPTR